MTPKSSVHRSLAKLGMLDSPDNGDPRNWLEEFLEKYSQGKELNMTEDQIRRAMADEKGMGFSEPSRILHRLGTAEQNKGQRGLTKFLSKWKLDFEEEDVQMTSPEDGSMSRSWSLIQSDTPPKVSTPPGFVFNTFTGCREAGVTVGHWSALHLWQRRPTSRSRYGLYNGSDVGFSTSYSVPDR